MDPATGVNLQPVKGGQDSAVVDNGEQIRDFTYFGSITAVLADAPKHELPAAIQGNWPSEHASEALRSSDPHGLPPTNDQLRNPLRPVPVAVGRELPYRIDAARNNHVGAAIKDKALIWAYLLNL